MQLYYDQYNTETVSYNKVIIEQSVYNNLKLLYVYFTLGRIDDSSAAIFARFGIAMLLENDLCREMTSTKRIQTMRHASFESRSVAQQSIYKDLLGQ